MTTPTGMAVSDLAEWLDRYGSARPMLVTELGHFGVYAAKFSDGLVTLDCRPSGEWLTSWDLNQFLIGYDVRDIVAETPNGRYTIEDWVEDGNIVPGSVPLLLGLEDGK